MMSNTKFTNVFVKNLSEKTTDENLRTTFDEFGIVTSAVIMKNQDGTSKCYGFVDFENPDDAARAVESLNGKKIDEKEWFVEKATEKPKGLNLYVKHLADNIQDEQLKEIFSPFGSITSHKVMRDQKGISKGFGFVAFSSHEEAFRALSAMNGKMVAGKPLFVGFAQSKEVRRANLQMRPIGHGPYEMCNAHPIPIEDFASILANVSSYEQKELLGGNLYPRIKQLEPKSAVEVTYILVEMDRTEVLHLLKSSEALKVMVAEAMEVLKHRAQRF